MRHLLLLAALLLAPVGAFAQATLPPAGSSTMVTPAGGTTAATLASEFGDRLTVKDIGLDATGAVDAGSAISTWLAGRTGVGGSTQLRFPKGTYTLGAAVDAKGRSPTWMVDWDANLDAYNLAQNGGWVVRPRRTNAWTYGTYDTACGASVIVNASYDQPCQVSGFSVPSLAASYSQRDSVAFYTANTAPPAHTVASATFTSTTMVPSPAVSTAWLQVGMLIDTPNSASATKYTGTITGWAADGSSVTVSGWFQQGNAAAGQVPPSGAAAVNPINAIWAQNAGCFLTATSEATVCTGFEMDTSNNKQALTPSDNPAAALPASIAYTAQSLGTYGDEAGYWAQGNYYYGFVAKDSNQAGYSVVVGGTRNPTYGFTFNIPTGTAFNASNPTTGNTWFNVTETTATTLTLGDGVGNSVINMYGHQTTGTPVRDAQLIAASGLLSARATTIQFANTANNLGLQVTAAGSGVNFVAITGQVTGTAPTIAATGTDTNVSLNLTTKGTGVLQVNGTAGVSCGAGTVNLATLVVTAGLVTHC